jgi:hypothetical protein
MKSGNYSHEDTFPANSLAYRDPTPFQQFLLSHESADDLVNSGTLYPLELQPSPEILGEETHRDNWANK